MQFKKTLSAIIAMSAIFSVLLFVSCGMGKKQNSARALSDVLRSDYTCNLDFTYHGKEKDYVGNADITKSGSVTRLDILSPPPFAGMSIEYDVRGLPENVAVHFSGMSTTLPAKALSGINSVASLFADDFAESLAKIPASSITEYESDNGKGMCIPIPYNGADITVYCSENGTIPYLLEYESEDKRVEIVFRAFSPVILQSETD